MTPKAQIDSVHAVLFDYGNVLSGPPGPVARMRMAEITGLDDASLERAYWAPRDAYDRGTHTGDAYWQAAGRHAGLTLTALQIDHLLAADAEMWTEPNQPMLDFAARLQAAGTPTGILSNLGDAMTLGVLARMPAVHAFNHRTWSYALGIAKPDPAIYAHAAAGLATPPANILFIDDREENIAGAQAAGFQAIHYTTQSAFEVEMVARGLAALWHTGVTVPMSQIGTR